MAIREDDMATGVHPPKKVELRDVVRDDLSILFEQQLDPVANKMAAFPARDWKDFVAHWSKILDDDSVITKTILYDGRVAGNVVSWEQEGATETGYWIGRSYWGRGIATAALTQFLDHVEARPLYAHVAKHNVASMRVLEKCGFSLWDRDENGSAHELVFKLES